MQRGEASPKTKDQSPKGKGAWERGSLGAWGEEEKILEGARGRVGERGKTQHGRVGALGPGGNHSTR